MFKTILAFTLVAFGVLHAHPEKLTRITGEHVQLQSINHGFAGSIKKRLISGFKQKGSFIGQLAVIENDLETKSVFKFDDVSKKFGGELVLQGEQGLQKKSIYFEKVLREENKFVFYFDQELTEVSVNFDEFTRGHFVNPEYSMSFRGEEYSFKLEGEACYGYSVHLITMIMGALVF